MSKWFVRPDENSVKGILEIIFGDGVKVKDSKPTPAEGKYIATFLCDDDELVALCACDLPFVGYSGAALSMMPIGTVQTMIDKGDFSPAIEGNYYEVMNICSKLLMSDTSAHLRLDKTYAPEEGKSFVDSFPEDATILEFNVDIPRYGAGDLTFMIK